MAGNSPHDYKSLLLQAEEKLKQAEEKIKQAEEREKQAGERQRQAEERQRLAEERREQEEERSRPTTFAELIHHSHKLLSKQIRVAIPSKSTTGSIPLPKGKHCPTKLRPWTDCNSQQQFIYDRVCKYLQPTGHESVRLFPSLIALEEFARRFALRPISSEQGLETYERIAVEDHVRDVISELCKIPAARDMNLCLVMVSEVEPGADYLPSRRPKPDQFCIHRVDGNSNSLLLTVEYKPPHKLSVENLRAGLRPMELWEEMVHCNIVPMSRIEKLQYNAERLTTSAIVQAYDVMIEEGRADAILTNGLARVLLHVPYDDPATLLYHLCEPNKEVDEELQNVQEPNTSIARVLCLCLRSFRSPTRDQEWRNIARSKVHVWETSFDYTRSSIPGQELILTPPPPSSGGPDSSDYQPSSSPDSPTVRGRRVSTRNQANCALLDVRQRTPSPNSSGSDSNQVTGRKRGFSQVISSPITQQAARQDAASSNQDNRPRNRAFCTQRCLLGLRTSQDLDESCPNIKCHRQGQDDSKKHHITAEDLLFLLKKQLDENIDRCTPIGSCGSYGTPFKLICMKYGYTVVGKGTTSRLWEEVSREVHVYQILRAVQGSAVPVFLSPIDLAKTYFLHGAGPICHMLVMAWAGRSTAAMELTPWLFQEIKRSYKEIKAAGIIHKDLRRDNILWSEELGRALIIDFHRSALKPAHPPRTAKRKCYLESGRNVKRVRSL
ncbi:hypothetical protein N7513_003275 [Penicillium frequentans]|uniref:Protein kinase domain-containing protein n=1 Tax=Penicillium frequentans TaxID=3151616 RepID=A0AAD6CI10_9EURO|nr:hypothetical protein N7494_013168 [Penicillium glabrum]KAJ5557689.1 hypothetical protein N7513_003275 [Penicillium glabrum]